MYRKNKYNNVKVEINGHKFDSKAESRRYLILLSMQQDGLITKLQLQPKFTLQAGFRDRNGKAQRAITYSADFRYYNRDGNDVVEDVKSPATAKDKTYRVKVKIFMYQNQSIHFSEVM